MKGYRTYLSEGFSLKAFAKIVANDSKRFFIARRSKIVDNPLTWAYPGGGVDPGERPSDAIMRELQEEIGGLPDGHEVMYVETTHTDNKLVFVYTIEVPTEFEPWLNDENDKYAWVHDLSEVSPLHPALVSDQ